MLIDNMVELLTSDKSFRGIRTHRCHHTLNPRSDSLRIELGTVNSIIRLPITLLALGRILVLDKWNDIFEKYFPYQN
jgi:hypothetical protein